MFLSKLIFNTRNRQASRDLSRPYEMHRTLWQAFPEGDSGRILFRVDTDRMAGNPLVLVQSDFRPEWRRGVGQEADYLMARPELKEFHPTVVAGQSLRFRLRANPTKKVGTPSKQDRLAGTKGNGQRMALLRDQDQVGWLLNKGDKCGFRIPGEWLNGNDGLKVPNFRVEIIPEGWVRCDKKGHVNGRFNSVRFDGVLEVTDASRFLSTLSDGIGPAKGFGFGLLSVAPP